VIYRILRWMSGIALHWFYGDIRVVDIDNIPTRGPLFIAVNHQNALIDSLITAWVVRRRVTMTAKATLMDNPFTALVFRMLGVVPLRRASDEVASANTPRISRSRNSDAFREILDVLEKQGTVLIFPEGKSHNERGLEPLKSGLARLALSAKEARAIRGVKILPLGLIFEDKGRPGSVVGVRVGNAIEMDAWETNDPNTLTSEIARRLRAISEEAGMPGDVETVTGNCGARRHSKLTEAAIEVAAFWGRITHEVPVRVARNLAVRRSRDADQPAMVTIVVGTGLVLLTYTIHFAVVDALVHSLWVSALYVASLLVGAYWTAFKDHRRYR
jgi:1-acyl-sn-glycerol-3-phosphate acyltransferase